MLQTPLIYNNNILDIETFIDTILFKPILKKICSCTVNETHLVYYITTKYFSQSNHAFQVYYKNNFLILQIKNKLAPYDTILTRIFYLENINTRKISHIYYDDSLVLKIPKIYYD